MRTLLHMASRRIIFGVLACIASATASAPALAWPIAYQVSGTASGSLGASSFVDAAFTLVGTADTNGLYQVPGLPHVVYANQLQSLTVSISTLGSFAATAPFSFFVNQTNSGAGFNDWTAGDAFDVTAPSFATYSAGSTFPASSVLAVYSAPFATTNGTLLFSSTSDLVFSASAVPEPSQLTLMGFGLVALLVWRTRRNGAEQ
jgi:hypothetical protein